MKSASVKPYGGTNTMSETAAQWGQLQIVLGKLSLTWDNQLGKEMVLRIHV